PPRRFWSAFFSSRGNSCNRSCAQESNDAPDFRDARRDPRRRRAFQPKQRPMKIITWNVQWCRGVDRRVDPARIVAHAKALADFDVLCLQEIASNFPDPKLAGSRGENQFAEIAQQ